MQVEGTNAILLVGLLPKGNSKKFDFGEGQNQYLNSTSRPQPELVDGEGHLLGFLDHSAESKSVFEHVKSWESPAVTNHLFDYQSKPGPFPRDNIKELFRRGAYLHPIRTLSGRTVTDDFPPNHLHHHGIWWAWTKTEFDGRKPDFWNMGEGKGRVDFVALDAQWSGPVHTGFRSRHDFVDLTAPKPVIALHETWQVTAYAPYRDQGCWLLDLVSEQSCATTNALKLPEYFYGGLGLRGNWAWNGKTNVNFLTADGETDRVKGNTQKARWCDMWGRIDGANCGIAILCHPSNFRAPQSMRIHPTEPFFCYAPQQGGDMEIKPGDTCVSRYRFVIHDGVMAKAELDRLWNDYAHPPVVKVRVE